MALLEINNLNVIVKDPITKESVKLIDNFSINIKEGEMTGLIGETGSGKSVIAQIIGGFIHPSWEIDCKSFRFNGKELLINNHQLNTTDLSTQVGIIYQDPGQIIDPSQKIRRQLIERVKVARQRSKDPKKKLPYLFWKQKINKEVEDLCTRVGIKDPNPILDSYLAQLSQTEAHLMAIIITILTDPLMIIADEPTTGLNAISMLRVQSLFKRLNANFHKTTLYLSNNFVNIKTLVTSAHFLYYGQVVERFNDLDEINGDIIDYAHHPYTNLFLRSLPNFANNQLVYKSKLYEIPGNMPEFANIPVGCRFAPRCEFSQRECMKFPNFIKDKESGYSEFACHFPINYLTPQQNITLKEIRAKIKKEIQEQLANLKTQDTYEKATLESHQHHATELAQHSLEELYELTMKLNHMSE